ncbi:deoxyhypusine synthase family protein [Candidatus Woesearchaeota archaeon]|nr:deoxyhypusine synthase family protein [Candidatus Woesearchaeota archaeon]
MDEKTHSHKIGINHPDISHHKFEPLAALDLSKITNFDDMTRGMSLTAFGGRELGEAVDVTEAMAKDKNCFKVLTLSGAMTMAQMSLLICDMIDNDMVNCIVSTGALMSHGFVEALGLVHYKNIDEIGDEKLRALKINRVYDTLEPEENFDQMTDIVWKVLERIDASKPTCSYKICYELGKYLSEKTKGRGIFKSAFRKNVPIFIPAFSDSEMGLDFALFNRQRKIDNLTGLFFDEFMDLEHYANLILKAKKTGIFTIGGGVPRNWAQQVAPYLDYIRYKFVDKGDPSKYIVTDLDNPYIKPFHYAVRICPEPVHWGGLSGCTYSESISWGKILPKSRGGRYAEVLCDATIAWPLIIKAVLERLGNAKGN